ncbi:MAG: KTSC domain-containing protein [Culicoidibacterales bacterium]
MELIQVNSTNLKAVGYDQESKVMVVQFQNQSVYHYYQIPHEVHRGLLQAESKGRYLNIHVKKQGYRYERV